MGNVASTTKWLLISDNDNNTTHHVYISKQPSQIGSKERPAINDERLLSSVDIEGLVMGTRHYEVPKDKFTLCLLLIEWVGDVAERIGVASFHGFTPDSFEKTPKNQTVDHPRLKTLLYW